MIAKEPERKALVVSQDGRHPRLYRQEVVTDGFHWLRAPEPGLPLHGRLRHRQPLAACVIDRIAAGGVAARFAEPQRAVAPGQYLALYQGRECLGCGEIA